MGGGVTMTVYPYRTPEGYRSILEAVDLADAKLWLWDCHGSGVRFCAVEMELSYRNATYGPEEWASMVDLLLSQHRNFVT